MLWDGRGACSPWLQGSPDTMTSVCWQTWVEIHPEAAGKLGIRDGDILEVTSPHGSLEAPAYLYRGIRPDTVAIPFGQGHTDLGRYARGRGANPIHLVGGKGQALAWAVVGVRLRRTGRRAALARMEDAVGVSEGFINQPFPGE
jgi:anaerobic selenocysteine-containing dehydrogenase